MILQCFFTDADQSIITCERLFKETVIDLECEYKGKKEKLKKQGQCGREVGQAA